MSLSFPLHSTMLSGIRKFCDYLFAFQFLLKSIIDMLTDSCIITIKQISQLLTCKPHSLTIQPDINLSLPVLCLIDYNLICLFVFHN